MIEVGRYNRLTVVKELDFGVYLDGKEKGEILLPRRYVPESLIIGDELEVFIYLDSEDRIIATTEKPYVQVGEFAMLRTKNTNTIGAFMDWGLMKDLLVPFREQKAKMIEGRSYLVYVYLDHNSGRIVASAKIEQFIDNTIPKYKFNQEVEIIPYLETDLGYKVIINGTHSGMVYHNEIFDPLYKGDRYKGYIKQVREDQKIDVSVRKMGYEKIMPLTEQIINRLQENDNYLPLYDKSPSEEIYQTFGCSKKDFKKAIGALYKEKKIFILPNGIRLL